MPRGSSPASAAPPTWSCRCPRWRCGVTAATWRSSTAPETRRTACVLVMSMSLVAQFYSPLQELTNMSQQIQQAATSGQRVFEVLDTVPDMEDKEEAVE